MLTQKDLNAFCEGCDYKNDRTTCPEEDQIGYVTANSCPNAEMEGIPLKVVRRDSITIPTNNSLTKKRFNKAEMNLLEKTQEIKRLARGDNRF
jgi:hypothetical protein